MDLARSKNGRLMQRFGLHSTRVLTPEGLTDATVVINGKAIESVSPGGSLPGIDVTELGDLVIMPGLIDSHVHINEPGRIEWEGFDTATKAAAAGGIATLVDMPLNSSPVTTNVKALDLKIKAAQKSIHVNCGFYGGLVPGNAGELEALVDAGVLGVKAFLTHSGIDDFPNVNEGQLREALPILKKMDTVLLVHAELDEPHADQALLEQDPRSYGAYLKSRPKSWEDRAIAMMIKLCDEFQVRIHIVHLSSAHSINQLRTAIKKGLPISVETCPHYLVFNGEDIEDGQTQFKCAPPIREKQNNWQLWHAVHDRVISFIVSDHSPALPAMKEMDSGNFKKAWGGIAGVQFGLPAFWTSAKLRGFTIEDVSALMSSNVAKFLGLSKSKGALAAGFDADIVVWNPEKEFTVTPDQIHHRHKVTPYDGLTLQGEVVKTFVNGHLVYDAGLFREKNKGEIVKKVSGT
jgi:allantoinase